MRILWLIIFAFAALPAAHAQNGTASPARPRLGMQQRFDQANVTHDGRLTPEQARTGYKSVARHFAAIDADKSGSVTLDEIRTYRHAQRAAHNPSARSVRRPQE